MSYGANIRPRTSGRLAVVERIDKTIRNLLDNITAGHTGCGVPVVVDLEAYEFQGAALEGRGS